MSRKIELVIKYSPENSQELTDRRRVTPSCETNISSLVSKQEVLGGKHGQ